MISGGEQQMLTICRTLMGDPDLIMIDEPTEGLAPQMVERIADLLQSIAERHISILLVEQKLTIAMRISHRVYVMGHGRMVFEGTPSELAADAGAPSLARSVRRTPPRSAVRTERSLIAHSFADSRLPGRNNDRRPVRRPRG